MKDKWDKDQIIGIILIPIVAAIIGWKVNDSLKNKDVELKYIEIAIDILRDKPKQETKALRLSRIFIVIKLP